MDSPWRVPRSLTVAEKGTMTMSALKRTAVTAASLATAALLLASCSSSSSSSPTTMSGGGGGGTTTSAAPMSTTNLEPYCPATNLNATKTGTKSLSSSGTETDYTTTGSNYQGVLTTCQMGMTQNLHYTVTSSGSGGAGQYGGGGLTGTKSGSYAAVEAGSSGSNVYINVCVWPAKPANTNCGENNQNN